MNSRRHRTADRSQDFYFEKYSFSEEFHPHDIVPPIFSQGDTNCCSVYALARALECRHRKFRSWAPGPKSRWRFSPRDLLKKLQRVTGKVEGFSLQQCASVLKKSGIGLYNDYEAMDWMNNEHQQPGCTFSLSSIDEYDRPSLNSPVKSWKSSTTGNVITIGQVVTEIANNGPVLGSFYTDPDFHHWSKESARELVYNGPSCDEAVGNQFRHLVCIIGYGGKSYEEAFFIAQNSHGLAWGDDGTFLLDPMCVDSIAIPILRRNA